MGQQYLIGNWPMQTTAAPVPVATGTAIKTLLQVEPGATDIMKVIAWGISYDGSAAATPGTAELIETDVAATVTAYVANDIQKWNAEALMGGDPTTALFVVGTANSGYTSTGEGTITAVRTGDVQLLPPTGPYVLQFPLGREFLVQKNKFLRVRVKFGTTVNALAWVLVEI